MSAAKNAAQAERAGATDPAALAEPTPLALRLMQLVRDHGPISVGDYMNDALCHPQHGYYATRDPFGPNQEGKPGGDFTTAPEISQLFGDLVGAWLVHAWSEIGEPSAFNLVELGPGRGTLMADILRVGTVRPGFLDAARLFMVEASGRMRYRQQRTLHEAGHMTEARRDRVVWADRLDDVPPGPTLIVANEFFDCLPIRQYVRAKDGWRERLVGLNEDGTGLAFVLGAAGEPDGAPHGARPEDIYEVSEAGRDLARQIAERFAAHKGRALIVDYGHGRTGLGDTFQAVKAHAHWPVLRAPGEADVTAHVDFAALARAARAAGARVDGPVRQGDFLKRLGLKQRLAKVAEARPDAADALRAGAARLAGADQMGHLFKVLAVSSDGLGEPAGFS